MPVNREALLQKLEKLGISKTSVYPGNHVTLAVEEFVAAEAYVGADIVGCQCGEAEIEPLATKGPALAPGSLVLTAEEVETMVLWYAGVA